MGIRALLVGLGGLSMLVMAAGCSAEVPQDEETRVAPVEGAAEVEGFNWMTCSGATVGTRAIATRLTRFAFGDDSFVFPATTACAAEKDALLDLRAALADNTFNIEHQTVAAVCGQYNVPVYWITSKASPSRMSSIVSRLEANTAACFGAGVLPYLVPVGSASYMYMDPEPATLTANLTSTQGASASAYWSTSLTPTVAKKWGATYGACGSAVAAGEPCATTALAAGQQAERLIQKNGTLCRCL